MHVEYADVYRLLNSRGSLPQLELQIYMLAAGERAKLCKCDNIGVYENTTDLVRNIVRAVCNAVVVRAVE